MKNLLTYLIILIVAAVAAVVAECGSDDVIDELLEFTEIRSMNDMGDETELLKLAQEGDTNAFDKLSIAYLDYPSGEFLPIAKEMADNYNYPQAYYETFYAILDSGGIYSPEKPLNFLDSISIVTAVDYLFKGAELGHKPSIELLHEDFSLGKINFHCLGEKEVLKERLAFLGYEVNNSQTPIMELDSLLNVALNDDKINSYYKDVYNAGKLIHQDDDNVILSITDSIFTNVNERRYFYFIVFTKSMNGSDGFYSEALGLRAKEFVENNTERFAHYFNASPLLTEKDFNNWAYYILGEIAITQEHNEPDGIIELEEKLIKNIKEQRKEYKPIIEDLITKVDYAYFKSIKTK